LRRRRPGMCNGRGVVERLRSFRGCVPLDQLPTSRRSEPMRCRRRGSDQGQRLASIFVGVTKMPRFNWSISGVSIALAVALAVWEVAFFFFGWERFFSLFVSHSVGFQLAWITTIYLSFQLISIPFAQRGSKGNFVGIIDGVASLLPLLIVV